MILKRYFILFSVLAMMGVAIATPSQAQTWQFTNVTSAAGFNYQHGIVSFSGSIDDERSIITGGVASGDYDNDGWVDLYIVRGDIGANLLFRNLGDGRFEEVGSAAGVDLNGVIGSGALFADLDGDNDLDLFVGGVVGAPPTLFRNLGNGTFSDITADSGLDSLDNSFGATAGDYDMDGDLDLYISHWIQSDNAGRGYLFQNDGNAKFSDEGDAAGLAGLINADFTANFSDINNDGWPDLLVVSDFKGVKIGADEEFLGSRVFINNQDGSFSDITDPTVITDENGMGATLGDYDNDGDLDWFVTSVWDPNGEAEGTWGITGNRLYRNRGDGSFDDVTNTAGVAAGYWGWGACFMDFNNDGQLDIFHVNGFEMPNPDDLRAQEFHFDPSRMFVSAGDGTFSEQSAALNVDDTGQGRGIVCFDYDKDGDIDIFVANNRGAPILYRNDGGNELHYLDVKLNGTAPNTEAIGAKVYVTVAGVTQMRELRAGGSFLSQNPASVHFGLGVATVVDELRVVWPSGDSSVINNILGDQLVTLPNTLPTLSWSSDAANGVIPESGNSGDSFVFKVIYTSSDNTAPTLAELWLDLNDDGIYAEQTVIAGLNTAVKLTQDMGAGELAMIAVFMLGSISFSRSRAGEERQRRWAVAVMVLLALLGSVSGCQSSTPEQASGSSLTPVDMLSERILLTEEDPTDQNYSDGKTYIASVTLDHAGDGNIKYTFRFCDQQNCTAPGNAIGEAVQDHQLTIAK